MVCTSAVDDIIHRFFERAVSRLKLIVETWRLDVSHYFWLLLELQASKQDSVTKATDPLISNFEYLIYKVTSHSGSLSSPCVEPGALPLDPRSLT